MQSQDGDSDLQLLLAITDLLASCSEGEEVESIESVCQSIYSSQELLRILSMPFLPPNRKRPFLRFLVWVYLSSNHSSHSGVLELTKSKLVKYMYPCILL